VLNSSLRVEEAYKYNNNDGNNGAASGGEVSGQKRCM